MKYKKINLKDVPSLKVNSSVAKRISSRISLFTFRKLRREYIILQIKQPKLIGAIVEHGKTRFRIIQEAKKDGRNGFSYYCQLL